MSNDLVSLIVHGHTLSRPLLTIQQPHHAGHMAPSTTRSCWSSVIPSEYQYLFAFPLAYCHRVRKSTTTSTTTTYQTAIPFLFDIQDSNVLQILLGSQHNTADISNDSTSDQQEPDDSGLCDLTLLWICTHTRPSTSATPTAATSMLVWYPITQYAWPPYQLEQACWLISNVLLSTAQLDNALDVASLMIDLVKHDMLALPPFKRLLELFASLSITTRASTTATTHTSNNYPLLGLVQTLLGAILYWSTRSTLSRTSHATLSLIVAAHELYLRPTAYRQALLAQMQQVHDRSKLHQPQLLGVDH
jgi:hypothetical protein